MPKKREILCCKERAHKYLLHLPQGIEEKKHLDHVATVKPQIAVSGKSLQAIQLAN